MGAAAVVVGAVDCGGHLMTFPCVDPNMFDPNGGAPTPREWLQWRHVATQSAASVEQLDIPPSASLPDILIHTLQVQYTNTTPIPQQVYGLITRGGTQWALNAPNQFTLNQSHGTAVGVAPPDPSLTLVSKMGGGMVATVTGFGQQLYNIIEDRAGTRTSLIGDTITLPVGQTYKARMELRLVGIVWDTQQPSNNTLNGADATEAERRFMSGDTRLDLFSYPLL